MIEFSINNKKLTIKSNNNKHIIIFFKSYHCNIWQLESYKKINNSYQFNIPKKSKFIALLIASKLFNYEKIDKKYYIFKFTTETMLQLL